MRCPNTWARPLESRLSTSHTGDVCRVCGGYVPAYSPAWLVAWRPGIAHEACGYLRADEAAPHEVACELSRWWVWKCPKCGRDAAAHDAPTGAPGPCMRCLPLWRAEVIAADGEVLLWTVYRAPAHPSGKPPRPPLALDRLVSRAFLDACAQGRAPSLRAFLAPSEAS